MDLAIFSRRTSFFVGEENVLSALSKIDPSLYFVTVNGSVVDDVFYITDKETSFVVHFRCLGGKGGFGSLLRSFRVNKSTNQHMLRDLSGRRLGDIKQEERLRNFIGRQAEKEKEKEEKKKAKYERLKAGDAKHKFNDPDYHRAREDILEATEDAFEEGFKNRKKPVQTLEESSSDDDSEDELPGPSGIKKRKRSSEEKEEIQVPEKREKNDSDSPESSVKVEPEPEPKIVAEVPVAKEVKPEVKDEKKEESPKEYAPIDLDSVKSTVELEQLGLDHLKHALEARGLKCGGQLSDRAARLFSVKGLKPEEYPKNVKAALLKGKKK